MSWKPELRLWQLRCTGSTGEQIFIRSRVFILEVHNLTTFGSAERKRKMMYHLRETPILSPQAPFAKLGRHSPSALRLWLPESPLGWGGPLPRSPERQAAPLRVQLLPAPGKVAAFSASQEGERSRRPEQGCDLPGARDPPLNPALGRLALSWLLLQVTVPCLLLQDQRT